MFKLYLGLAIFFAPHVLPMFAGARQRMVDAVGLWPYKGIVAVVSLIGFYFIVVGKGAAPFEALYNPPAWGRMAPTVLMLPALILLFAAYIPGNIRRFTAHPMLWGVVLWAAGHLLANGDLASVWLFGSFLVYSLLDMWSANRRSGERRRTGSTPLWREGIVIVLGAMAYGGLLYFHGALFGIPLVP